ncbi:MAG: antibiotic biosynthesis monooxygenase [Streptococcaceae bacterium]|nr:antibiotic biosynthesis monooxygenase [Streptococcaceae bacterium]
MITINLSFYPKEEKEAEFIDFMKNLAEQSKQETGNITYNFAKDLNEEHKYTLIEHWITDSYLQNHRKTNHFAHFTNNIDKLIKKMSLTSFDAVPRQI